MAKVSNNKSLYKKIDNCKIVSFDVFDTLIKRNCLIPTDIFDIVECTYNTQEKQTIVDFKKNRISAERIAREKSEKEDINLDEIYNNFTTYDKEKLQKLKQIEIETELKFCVKNELMYNIYDYCKKKDKKIICISDMYLSKEVINKILLKNGYDIDQIFVSSEIGKLKRTGNLFKHVLDENNIEKRKMIHIGDSKKSDFLIPKFLGIKTYLIPRFVNNCTYVEFDNCVSLNTSILYAFINNNVMKNDNKYHTIGYEILGPIIYSFCLWIHNLARKTNVDNLLFCARDMQIIQKAYKTIYKDEQIKNNYLYISRKSIKLPFLYKNNTFGDFCSLITDKKMTINDILSNNGININNLESILEKYSLSAVNEYNYGDIVNSYDFEKFYNNEIKKELLKNSKTQYKYFKNYLESLYFNENSAIIDLGWRGTIQYSLAKIFNISSLKGFYLGIEKRAYKELDKQNSFGYLFDQYSDNDYEDKIYSFRSLFELFFSAQHGSTLKYASEKDNYYILGASENKNDNAITQIQDGAMIFIEDFVNYSNYINDLDTEEIIFNLIKIGTSPTREESIVFGNLNFDNMICGKLASPDKIIKYILNPKKLKKDLFKSEWKVGFLKRLLIIKLPYYKIYNFLRKNKKEV